MSADEMTAWLRKQVEADLAAARIISAGGFGPQRWDTKPPGQVNPKDIPQSDAVTAALGCAPEYICGWVQIVAYDKLNNEPDESYGRDSEAPLALVDNGRREADHIIRHDPRNVIADCEAKLELLDYYAKCCRDDPAGFNHRAGRASAGEVVWLCLRRLAKGYRHREGWQERWPMPQQFQ